MASTRFYDDDARVKKRLEESLTAGLYHMDVPGNGLRVPFLEDPRIRLEKWGANLRTNTVDLESDFRGLNHKLKNDREEYTKYTPNSSERNYSIEKSFIDESRASCPAWMFRDKQAPRWLHSFHDVQSKATVPFTNNESTRILVKNSFIQRVPVVENNENDNYYLSGESICLGGRC